MNWFLYDSLQMKHVEENCGSWSEWSQTLLILTGTDYWCETESFTSLKIYWGNFDFSVFLNVSVVERSHAVFGELIFLVCRMKMKLVTFWIKITECFFVILNSFFLWSSKTEKQIKIRLKERLKTSGLIRLLFPLILSKVLHGNLNKLNLITF